MLPQWGKCDISKKKSETLLKVDRRVNSCESLFGPLQAESLWMPNPAPPPNPFPQRILVFGTHSQSAPCGPRVGSAKKQNQCHSLSNCAVRLNGVATSLHCQLFCALVMVDVLLLGTESHKICCLVSGSKFRSLGVEYSCLSRKCDAVLFGQGTSTSSRRGFQLHRMCL